MANLKCPLDAALIAGNNRVVAVIAVIDISDVD